MQTQINDATAAARRVISSLEENIKQVEAENKELVELKAQLHTQVQTTLKPQ